MSNVTSLNLCKTSIVDSRHQSLILKISLQTDKPLRIEVNTVGSANCLENPPYRKHILTVAANKTMVRSSIVPYL